MTAEIEGVGGRNQDYFTVVNYTTSEVISNLKVALELVVNKCIWQYLGQPLKVEQWIQLIGYEWEKIKL